MGVRQEVCTVCQVPRDAADAYKRFVAENAALRNRVETISLELRGLRTCIREVVEGSYSTFEDSVERVLALRKRVEELEQAHAVCLSVHKDVEQPWVVGVAQADPPMAEQEAVGVHL